MISICTNHPLIDANQRLALAATIVMLGINGWVLTMSDDEAYDLTMAVAEGTLSAVDEVAERLQGGSRPQ